MVNVNRAMHRLGSAAVLGVAIVVVGSLGIANAATGGNFILGHTNRAAATSVLRGTTGTPLSLVAPAGKPPLAVSNGVKVARLNADKLDGLDSTTFLRLTLPAGRSESGAFAASGGDTAGDWIGVSINFPQRLATVIPNDHVIWTGNGADSHCAGPGHAAAGYLCLYLAESLNANWYGARDDLLTAPQAGSIVWFVNGPGGNNLVGGTWTVTAP